MAFAGFVVAAGLLLQTGQERRPPWLTSGEALSNYFLVKAPADLVGDDAPDSPARLEIEALKSQYGVVAVTPMHARPPRGRLHPVLAEALGLDRFWFFELDRSRHDLDQIIARFARVSGVERVWRDGRITHCGTPDDSLWSSQWNLHKAKLDCEAAWDSATQETVPVAVIDSGVDLSHKDLKNNVWSNPGEKANNGKDDDQNGFVDDSNGWDFWNGDSTPRDDNGHGSHVAGILGAEGNNKRDVAGVCWKAQIQVVKVLDSSGGGTWASIAQGLVYAADNGARVVNMSLGGNDGDAALESAVAYAAGLDVVQVAAAGNKANDVPFYPAAYEAVIAVMASDPNDKRPGWSNRGSWCDLLAPGDGVYSLWKSGLTNILSGTSQAAPHVAGVAALLRTLNPQLDRVDVELAIETSCDDLGEAGRDSEYQWGRLNAREAVRRAAMLVLEATEIKPGKSVELWLSDAAHPGDLYLILPTLADRSPGYTLDFFFDGETATVPINLDWLSLFCLVGPDVGVFDDFLGSLDANGRATAKLNLPKGNELIGKTIHFAAFTVDPADLTRARRVTNSVGLHVR